MKNKKVNAIKVHQWLKDWGADYVQYDKKSHRSLPKDHFYMFSLSARTLRTLSGIYRRKAEPGRKGSDEYGIQRGHESKRSENIREYIKYGYPWSDLSRSQRKEKFHDLRKPGWLPTAIVINVLEDTDKREGGKKVNKDDLIKILDDSDDLGKIVLPESYTKKDWKPKAIFPIEIIDGQHRLFAFDEQIDEDYELPVVAFHGLDISWQAYLFWTINIKPKRINPSLAFDLYPLLRTEEWLDRFEGHKVYREARSQELVESLWSFKKSSWYQRINMLGESGSSAGVTQAAWVRALMKTYVKASEGKGIKVGGLFGAPVGEDNITIPWNRAQQAAFLIMIWNELEKAVKISKSKWANELRNEGNKKSVKGDFAFMGSHTLLNNDQGITAVLNITNDLFYKNIESLGLMNWDIVDVGIDVDFAYDLLLKKKKIIDFAKKISVALAKFDWRSSGSPSLTEDERIIKLAFRGGSGYREFRRQILLHLKKESGEVGRIASSVHKTLYL